MKKKLALLLALTALVTLGACSKNPEVTPTDTVDSFLQAIQKDDISQTDSLYEDGTFDLSASSWPNQDEGEDDEDLESETFLSVMQKDFYPKLIDFDYEITDSEISGKTATVNLDVTAYPLGDSMYQGYKDYFKTAPEEDGVPEFNEDNLAKYIQKRFQATTKKSMKNSITITLSLDDDKWVIDTLSDENVDALSGGMVTCYSNVQKYLDKIYS